MYTVFHIIIGIHCTAQWSNLALKYNKNKLILKFFHVATSCLDFFLLHLNQATYFFRVLVKQPGLDQFSLFSKLVVVVFPQAPFRATNVPGQASAGIIQLCNNLFGCIIMCRQPFQQRWSFRQCVT